MKSILRNPPWEIQVCSWLDDSWVNSAGATCVWKLAMQKKNNAQISDIDPHPQGMYFYHSFYHSLPLWGFHTDYIQHSILFVVTHHFVEVHIDGLWGVVRYLLIFTTDSRVSMFSEPCIWFHNVTSPKFNIDTYRYTQNHMFERIYFFQPIIFSIYFKVCGCTSCI